MDIANKGVLVTGGASGLGAACVRLLAQAGARIVIADVNSEAGINLATEHNQTGESTFFVKADVTGEANEKRNRRFHRGSGGSTHRTRTVRNKGSLRPWRRVATRSQRRTREG